MIAATNKNLEELVKGGTFREDLYFRLKVVEVLLPPLRERLEDVPLLAHAFLKEFASENGKAITSFTTEVLELLIKYPWPGNVRELRTAMEHAVVMCRGDKLTAKDFPASVRNSTGDADADPQRLLAQGNMTLQEAEKQLIIRALKETDGNRTLAARKIGMSRRTFHRKLHEHHLEGF